MPDTPNIEDFFDPVPEADPLSDFEFVPVETVELPSTSRSTLVLLERERRNAHSRLEALGHSRAVVDLMVPRFMDLWLGGETAAASVLLSGHVVSVDESRGALMVLLN